MIDNYNEKVSGLVLTLYTKLKKELILHKVTPARFSFKESFQEIILNTLQEENVDLNFRASPTDVYSVAFTRAKKFKLAFLLEKDSEDCKNFKILAEYFFKCPWAVIVSKSRKQEHVTARQFIAAWIKDNTQFSLARIGNFLGNRDHSTIINARDMLSDLLTTDKGCRYLWTEWNELLEKYTKNETSQQTSSS